MTEAVIVDAIRTPIGKRKGKLAGWHPTDLLAHVLNGLVERNGIDPALVDDVIGGCVTQSGEQSTNVTRNAWVAAGLPHSVPATSVDRQCGSSQQAVHFAAQGVMAGAYDLVIACGVESMSRAPMASNARGGTGPFSQQFLAACDGQLKMQFEVAQKIANDFGITRAEMDQFALESHRRASEAAKSGAFDREILPIHLRDEEGNLTDELMTADEGIRHDASLEKMASLASAHFQPELAPDITAGNSSQMNDAAAGMLIASRETAEKLGLRPRAAFRHFAVGGDDAVWVLTAPNPVTRKLFAKTGLSVDDLDAIEVNEAFASIAMAWEREFKPESAKLNPRGGAIAIGHPLGASGVRLMTTMLHYLEDTGGRLGLQTMCEGGGQANVTVIERLGD
ncbi:MAG: acetyl-CoA C-acyltransferase [Frankiaceae bacterium]|nr:acetyl-CoA C-acyltransferase [Frankiaceae bacterium]MBV9871762.1 acetyl-CoA C-acyltransferase [Frankiaceae bacterium]